MESDKKEQWVTKTLASLKGIHPAEAPGDLAERVRRRVGWGEAPARAAADLRFRLVPRAAWSMAACAVFLLTVNVFTCLHFGQVNHATPPQVTAFAQEYFAFTPTLSL